MRTACLALILGLAGTALAHRPLRANLASADPAEPVEAAAPAVPEGSVKVTLAEQERDGLFYIVAEVNGKPVRFVVDTGASVVVLNRNDAARVGLTTAIAGTRVDTAGGATAMHRATIAHVAIAGQTIHNVDAAVVGGNLEVSLLGQSVLSQLQSLTLKRGRLQLN
jgi:aspartyl protease family protein